MASDPPSFHQQKVAGVRGRRGHSHTWEGAASTPPSCATYEQRHSIRHGSLLGTCRGIKRPREAAQSLKQSTGRYCERQKHPQRTECGYFNMLVKSTPLTMPNGWLFGKAPAIKLGEITTSMAFMKFRGPPNVCLADFFFLLKGSSLSPTIKQALS